jgi:ABC-type multidrug transport system fused ATPase/permease subunit
LKLNSFIKIFTSNDVSKEYLNNATSYFYYFVFNSLFDSLYKFTIRLFILSFVKSIREYYVKNLFTKDIEFFDQQKTSDLFSLLTEDIQNLTDTSILELFEFIKTLSKGIGSVFLMFYFYFKLSCFLIIILPILFFIIRYRHKQAMKEHKNIREQRHSSHHIVLESLENIKTVKAFSTEEKEINKYEIQLKKMWDEQYKFLIKSMLTKNIVGIIFIAAILLIIRYGIYLAKKAGEKDENFAQNLFPFILYCGMLIGTFNEIADKFEKCKKVWL